MGICSIHTTHFPDGHLMNDKAIREMAIFDTRIIITKDADFYDYFHVKGAPPSVLLLTMGNISNAQLFLLLERYKTILEESFLNGAELVIFDGNDIISF